MIKIQRGSKWPTTRGNERRRRTYDSPYLIVVM
jgi:hypothetical protein